MIPFSKPYLSSNTILYMSEVLSSGRLSGDHTFTKKCNKFLEEYMKAYKVLLTTSGTHALEMAALLSGVKPGDDVICPSFTFSSSANAFALRGAKIRFVDVDANTMNVTAEHIEKALTKNTKAICVVHYAGVPCDMDPILALAKNANIPVIEDAAQALSSKYKGRAAGTIGSYGCLSFHETKNITCGEGGAFILNVPEEYVRAEIIREKGTNRAEFFRGDIDKYSWKDIGSSYLPSDLNAAFLYSQLEELDLIQKKRMALWMRYQKNLSHLSQKNLITVPQIPSYAEHNAHIFFIKLKDVALRTQFIAYMKEHQVQTSFHYVPLHSSIAGQRLGEFVGEDKVTTRESERLVRLPLYADLQDSECDFVCEKVEDFFKAV